VQPDTVEVSIKALQPVTLTVTTDGRVAFQGLLHRDEARTFTGNASIQIQMDKGGVAAITVNGHDIGTPGTRPAPFSAVFTPESFGGKPSAKSP
jgi:hypothetical protein